MDKYALNEALATPLLPIQQSADLAYMIYSPKLSDVAKGIIATHQEAVGTIAGINHRIDIDQLDRVYPMSAFSDDLWAYTIFGTLAAGGTLVIPQADPLTTPAQWESWMNEWRVTVWTTTQAELSALVKFVGEQGRDLPGELRCVLLSEGEGEAENVQVTSLG